jgi:hypothetical protein
MQFRWVGHKAGYIFSLISTDMVRLMANHLLADADVVVFGHGNFLKVYERTRNHNQERMTSPMYETNL